MRGWMVDDTGAVKIDQSAATHGRSLVPRNPHRPEVERAQPELPVELDDIPDPPSDERHEGVRGTRHATRTL